MLFFDALRKIMETGEHPAVGDATPTPEDLRHLAEQPASLLWTGKLLDLHVSTCSARRFARYLTFVGIGIVALLTLVQVAGAWWLRDHMELRELQLEKKVTKTVIEILREKGLLSAAIDARTFATGVSVASTDWRK
jgi:hypothetical protein